MHWHLDHQSNEPRSTLLTLPHGALIGAVGQRLAAREVELLQRECKRNGELEQGEGLNHLQDLAAGHAHATGASQHPVAATAPPLPDVVDRCRVPQTNTAAPAAHLAPQNFAHLVGSRARGVQQSAVNEQHHALARRAASALAVCRVPAMSLLR